MSLLLLFFLSGATALVYEVVWSKYLGLMFGSTVHAQTVVLASFMGGLALGNWLLGKRADRIARPLRFYGILECGIGLFAFCFEYIYALADTVFVALGSPVADRPVLLLCLKGTLSLALLLPPTICMGGTLPLLAGWLQRTSLEAGRKSVRFYAVNSLGAVCGAATGGLFLVQNLGIVATLQLVGLVNVLVGLAAMILSQRISTEPARNLTGEPERAQEPERTPIPWSSAVVLVTVTGAASMGLEVLASRSLSLIFGASLEAFAIVLIAFILGIGLSGALISSKLLSRVPASRVILVALVGAASVVGFLILGFVHWVDIYRHVKTGIAPTIMGYRLHQGLIAFFALIVLGIPAGLIGSVLPVCLKAQGGNTSNLGGRVGQLLTWNTIGAVTGVLLTGFVLMPLIGLRGAFLLLASLLAAAGLIFALSVTNRVGTVLSGTTIALLLLTASFTGEGWRHVMSSGVFRARETVIVPGTFERRQQHVKLLFYEDAADATVTVEEGDGIGAPADRGLRVNGKPDASREGDLSTQLLLAHLPMLVRPDATEVFVVGLGSGITAGSLLGHPVRRLDVAENCEPVLRAAKLFDHWNSGVLTNERVRIFQEDARTVLKLKPTPYDVIISQPSNPWMAGVGSVFSREYYELAADRLKPGGVMAQWFHIYEMSDGIVNLVLRTFGSVFPYMEVWDTSSGDIILLGSKTPIQSNNTTFARIFEREKPRRDLERIGLASIPSLFARQFASQRTAQALTGDGGIQSDKFPVLEYEAPKAFFIGAAAHQLLRFDERTWQRSLLAAEKRNALASLSESDLRHVFSRGTINPQLASELKASAPQTPFMVAHPIDSQHWTTLGLPTELQERLSSPAPIQPSEFAEIADAHLASHSPFASKQAQTHFAAYLAKRCLAGGDVALAEKIVKMGLGIAFDPELEYLSRVLNGG